MPPLNFFSTKTCERGIQQIKVSYHIAFLLAYMFQSLHNITHATHTPHLTWFIAGWMHWMTLYWTVFDMRLSCCVHLIIFQFHMRCYVRPCNTTAEPLTRPHILSLIRAHLHTFTYTDIHLPLCKGGITLQRPLQKNSRRDKQNYIK